MIFCPYQKLLSDFPITKVYDPILNKSQILEMKNFVKYLGILIDFDLSWKNHIDLICQKISKTLGILARLRHSIPLTPLLKNLSSSHYPLSWLRNMCLGRCVQAPPKQATCTPETCIASNLFETVRDHVVPSSLIPAFSLFLSFIFIGCAISCGMRQITLPPRTLAIHSLRQLMFITVQTRSSTVEHSKLEKST